MRRLSRVRSHSSQTRRAGIRTDSRGRAVALSRRRHSRPSSVRPSSFHPRFGTHHEPSPDKTGHADLGETRLLVARGGSRTRGRSRVPARSWRDHSWAMLSTASVGSTSWIRKATRRAGWRRVMRRSHPPAQELTIRDLESPGGTFVNQQRLLSGQARRLQPGDVVQLGSVQLRVKLESPAATPPAAPAKAPVAPGPARAAAVGGTPAVAASPPGTPAKPPVAPPAKAAAPSPVRRACSGGCHPLDAGGRYCRSRSRWPGADSVEPGTTSWCSRPSAGRRFATS